MPKMAKASLWLLICSFLQKGISFISTPIFTRLMTTEEYGYVAAGYTTLICYMIYAFFHYCAMKKICNEKYEGKNPYNTKIILIITVLFLMIGFAFLALYNHLILRYILISILAIICISLIKKIKGEKKYE